MLALARAAGGAAVFFVPVVAALTVLACADPRGASVGDFFAAFVGRAGVDAVDDGAGERRCFDVAGSARGDWTGVAKGLDCVDASSGACTTGVADVAWERTLACVSLLQQP